MTASKIFLYLCLSFIGGIFLSSMLGPEPINYYGLGRAQIFVLGFLISGLILISVLWKYKKIVVIGFCILFLVAGIWRHQQAELRSMKSELRSFDDSDVIIAIVGVISTEPDIKEKSQKLIIEINETRPRSIKEKVLITTNRYPEYQYGDELKITGKLKTPQIFEEFNYKNYLNKEGIYSVMDWPKIELIAKNQGNIIYSKILSLKEKLRESIYQNLSSPQSSILGAVILGDKRKISDEWKEKLNITGVRHITAISGMHITILAGILVFLGIALGLWRGQVFYFAITFLTFYIVMIGLQPSAIRAGIMASLFLLAQKLGRLAFAQRTIVFAAAFMLFLNPLLLKSDVGFQLSFLALMGIIYLMPTFQNWLKFFPNPEIFPLRSLLSMTISAQVFTLPILIYNFGYISLVAPFTNVLIVPLLPFLMIVGFIFGITGIIFQTLAQILAWPAWLLLTYLTKIVDWFSQIPWAYKTIEIHWIFLVISYLILGYFAYRLNKRRGLVISRI